MTPTLSVVVVAYDMARELPRTLRSLSPGYQGDIDVDDYEVIVVDNGSPEPVTDDIVDGFGGQLRTIRIDPAPPSPAMAANRGLAEATGDLVGLVLDGARMASPRLLARARLAARLADRPVIATLGWHLGPASHMDAATTGWDHAAEDALLTEIGWEDDGYRLFEASVLAGSSQRGWFGPMGESHALFLPRALWDDLGGLDERFAMPGGGLVNHDLYRRACSLPDTQLVVLLGEGTFHQFHGGAATSRRFGRDEMFADYERIRGECYEPPDRQAMYLGTVPPEAMAHLESSLAWARRSATSAPA